MLNPLSKSGDHISSDGLFQTRQDGGTGVYVNKTKGLKLHRHDLSIKNKEIYQKYENIPKNLEIYPKVQKYTKKLKI